MNYNNMKDTCTRVNVLTTLTWSHLIVHYKTIAPNQLWHEHKSIRFKSHHNNNHLINHITST